MLRKKNSSQKSIRDFRRSSKSLLDINTILIADTPQKKTSVEHKKAKSVNVQKVGVGQIVPLNDSEHKLIGSPHDEYQTNLSDRLEKSENDLALESEESLIVKHQLIHARTNLLRKLLAVWCFQVIFCLVIFVGEYNNKLSDHTNVGESDWEALKVSAMGREFQEQDWFVSNPVTLFYLTTILDRTRQGRPITDQETPLGANGPRELRAARKPREQSLVRTSEQDDEFLVLHRRHYDANGCERRYR